MEYLFSPLGLLATAVVLTLLLFAANEPVRGLTTVVVYGIVASLATTHLMVVGAGVALLGLLLVPRALLDRRNLARFDGAYYRSPADLAFAAIGIISVIELFVGIARKNEAKYIAADFFHVMFEMTIPYFLFKIYFHRLDNIGRFLESTWKALCVVSVVLLVLLATGFIRKIPGTGDVMAHTNFWRFNYSHHYPLNPLLLFTAMLAVASDRRVDRWLLASVVALLLTLVVSLKRATWLAYFSTAAIIPFVISQRNRLRVGGALFVGATAVGFVLLLAPGDIFQPITGGAVIGRASSMGKGTQELGNRFEQTSLALDLIGRNPLGYGMGASLETLKAEETHYVHNTFLHYALQGSVFLPFFMCVVLFRATFDGFRLYRSMEDGWLRGAVLGSTLGLLAMIQTSLTEVTVNTYFFAIFPAIIYSARRIHERFVAENRGEDAPSREEPFEEPIEDFADASEPA